MWFIVFVLSNNCAGELYLRTCPKCERLSYLRKGACAWKGCVRALSMYAHVICLVCVSKMVSNLNDDSARIGSIHCLWTGITVGGEGMFLALLLFLCCRKLGQLCPGLHLLLHPSLHLWLHLLAFLLGPSLLQPQCQHQALLLCLSLQLHLPWQLQLQSRGNMSSWRSRLSLAQSRAQRRLLGVGGGTLRRIGRS